MSLLREDSNDFYPSEKKTIKRVNTIAARLNTFIANEVSSTSGTSGANGTSGVSGTSGTAGSHGNSGTSGANGTSGVNGTSGTTGTSGTSGTGGLILLASKTGVDGATLASTNLTFAGGVALSTHTPLYVVFKYASGTLGIGVARIKTGSSYLLAVTALLTLTSSDNNFVSPLSGAVTNSGSITAEITTASLGASSIDVYVYGIAKP